MMSPDLIAQRYQLHQMVYDFGEAAYYEAVDLQHHQPVVIRVIDISQSGAVGIGLEHLAAEKLKNKMLNELRLIERLKHPGLLDVLDYGVEVPLYYLVYPSFTFENLHMRITQSGPLPSTVLLPIIASAAETLADLHTSGIVHGDISAETVLIADEQAKVIEFSIANQEQMDGVVPGDPVYLSPEAITGAALAPSRDIWALGVTLYYGITGSLPFGALEMPRHEGVPRLFQNVLSQPVPPIQNPDLPLALLKLMDQMLEKDPAKRAPSMAFVAETLRALNEPG